VSVSLFSISIDVYNDSGRGRHPKCDGLNLDIVNETILDYPLLEWMEYSLERS
jgi:hypothetical protein